MLRPICRLPTSSVLTPVRWILPGETLTVSLVVRLALVDRDVVHPHGVLLRHRRDVGKPHRVAVVDDLPLALARRRPLRAVGLGRIEARHLLSAYTAAYGRPVVGGLRRQRIERLAVGVAVVDDRTFGVVLRHAGHRGRGGYRQLDQPGLARPQPGSRRGHNGRDGRHPLEQRAHWVALTMSLFSTVPVSPCTLAPSDKRPVARHRQVGLEAVDARLSRGQRLERRRHRLPCRPGPCRCAWRRSPHREWPGRKACGRA